MRLVPAFFIFLLAVLIAPSRADLTATFNSATDIPVAAGSYTASGTFSTTLNFAPPTGTTLTVVKNTGLDFIAGTFSNLAQGQLVTLSYGGINYRFIANYYGGTGNDLVLQWANTRVLGWGDNSAKVLLGCIGATQPLPSPLLLNGALSGKTVMSLRSNNQHTLALCSDGTIAAWGNNFNGQLGNNSTTNSPIPVFVSTSGVLSGKIPISIAITDSSSLALCSDGSMVAWGNNFNGVLGNGNNTDSSVPVSVSTVGALAGKTVVSVAGGTSHFIALCSDGTIVTWGLGPMGQAGINDSTPINTPLAVQGGALSGKTAISIAAGGSHSLALCSDGTVVAWGANVLGQVGNNSKDYCFEPVALNGFGILTGKTVLSLVAGGEYSLARCSDGTIASWGSNSGGQLGRNVLAGSLVPVPVDLSGILAGKTVIDLNAGYAHSMALCSDGTLAAWGHVFGGIGNFASGDAFAPVAVRTSALRSGEIYSATFAGPTTSQSLVLASSPASPVPICFAATSIAKTSATLNGTLDPNGSATSAVFEFGPDASYGRTAGVTVAPADGLGAQAVNASVTGLSPGTVYHYRLTATNAAGTVSTEDRIFATSGDLSVLYNSPTDVPISAPTFTANGATFQAALQFPPSIGSTLMVVKNTGPDFINGRFANLAQGQKVTLVYQGFGYSFIANYHGGSGNDLVLQWAETRPVAWGDNTKGQLGDNTVANKLAATSVFSTGVLAGKSVMAFSAGQFHSLALCSDGTVAAWGFNSFGRLGNGSSQDSKVPVAVKSDGALAGKTVIAIAAGSDHSLALSSDGQVMAWGANTLGQLGNGSASNSSTPTPVNTTGILAGKTVVAIAAGDRHSLALCSDGTLAAWGGFTFGNLPVELRREDALTGKTIVSIAVGRSEYKALCADGTIATWEDDNVFPNLLSPAGAFAGKTVVSIVSGDSHLLGLCSDGSIVAWGDHFYGQLGNNSFSTGGSPNPADTLPLPGKTFTAIAAGDFHSMALCSDGTLATWGDDSSGQLGDNSTTKVAVPVPVSTTPLGSGERYAAVFGSGSTASHSLGLIASLPFPKVSNSSAANFTSTQATLSGTVNPNGNTSTAIFEYGPDTNYGQTASVTLTPNDGLTPQNVSAALSGLFPGTTYHYRLTVTNMAGTASTADATFTTSINLAATFNAATDIPLTASSVQAAGGTFAATLNFAPPTGTTLTVIKNTGFSPIQGTFANLAQWQVVTLRYGGIDYQFIANYYGGNGNDLVLQWAKTRLTAWGYNVSNQLGDGSNTNRSVPVSIPVAGALTGKTIPFVVAGGSHSLALCADGTVAAWGSGSAGQLAILTGSTKVPTPINAGGALTGKSVVAVAAGNSFSLALCSDGTVAAWGTDLNGELGDNGSSSAVIVPVAVVRTGALAGKSVVAIAAGANHTLALCSDGTLVSWGRNNVGQLGNNSTTTSRVPVAVTATGALAGKTVVTIRCGANFSAALCSDGTVVAWGDNGSGQLGSNVASPSLVPVAVDRSGVLADKTIADLAAGNQHCVALCTDGTMVGWGNNGSGELATIGLSFTKVPILLSNLGVLSGKTITALSAANSNVFALCSDGTVGAWGNGILGTLGNNSASNSATPVAVSASGLAAGELFSSIGNCTNGTHVLCIVALPPAPIVTMGAATDLAIGSITLQGTVNAATGSAAVFFDYGLTTAYGSSATPAPSPVTGASDTAVSASLVGLLPGTTYHYRLRATTAGGTAISADFTFTMPPGGTMALAPASPFDAGAPLTVTFAGWTDPNLTYAVLVDDLVVSPQASSAVCNFAAPATPGAHTLRGRVYDALGHYAELRQNFIVYTSQESWRVANFGTPQNTGNAADAADPDGDGFNNWFEYVAGLTPTDGTSRFQVRVEMVAGQLGQKAIVFGPVMPGRTYTVKSKAGLADATWTALTNFTTSDNGSERTVLDLNAGNDLRFYEVEITLP